MKFIIILLFSIIIITNTYAETSPTDLQRKVKNTINIGQKIQKKADAWANERTEVLNQIREQKNMKNWLLHQQKKYKIYIEKQKQAIAELERRKKETLKINMSLEPFLDDLVVKMEKLVTESLPFLPEERQRRIQFLHDSLNDYNLNIAEKTKRTFEALQVEAGYGSSVEHNQTSIDINGIQTQVDLFRLGNLGLFYKTLDGKNAGRFNNKTKTWESVLPKYIRHINQSVAIAEKKQTPVLLNLPIGKAGK